MHKPTLFRTGLGDARGVLMRWKGGMLRGVLLPMSFMGKSSIVLWDHVFWQLKCHYKNTCTAKECMPIMSVLKSRWRARICLLSIEYIGLLWGFCAIAESDGIFLHLSVSCLTSDPVWKKTYQWMKSDKSTRPMFMYLLTSRSRYTSYQFQSSMFWVCRFHVSCM